MTPLELGLSAWIAFNSALGVDLQASLLAPAEQEQIEQVETVIGYSLPEDLQQLYLHANGQLDPFETPVTGRYAPMFGRYRFLSLAQALTAYQQLQTQYEADQQWRASSSGGQQVLWDVREGDHVDAAGWNPQWFVFASDETNFYSVDMTPPAGGQSGQVVLHGPGQWELRVVAGSVAGLLSEAAARLDPDEPYRYEESGTPGETEAGSWSYLQFTMDWRVEPVAPAEPNPQEEAALDAWHAAREAQIDSFMLWLDGKPWSPAEMSHIEDWVYISFSLGPSGLFSEPLQGNLPPYTHQDYLASLEINLMLPSDSFIDPLPVSRLDAYELVHLYQLESGRWNLQEYEDAHALLHKFAD